MGGEIRIGTSGWNYKHWKGPFYPERMPDSRLLEHYVKFFDTVELNATFYRLPAEKNVERWRDSVPPGFLFSVKGSRYITHVKRLKEAGGFVKTFVESVRPLGDKLGPILFQLHPGLNLDLGRFESFLGSLPPGFRYVFEFRNPAWHIHEVYRILSEKGMGFCIYDFGGRLSPAEVTSDMVYIRLHGPLFPYMGRYGDEFIREWAAKMVSWSKEGLDVFCYFDNDERGYAANDALRLKKAVGGNVNNPAHYAPKSSDHFS